MGTVLNGINWQRRFPGWMEIGLQSGTAMDRFLRGTMDDRVTLEELDRVRESGLCAADSIEVR